MRIAGTNGDEQAECLREEKHDADMDQQLADGFCFRERICGVGGGQPHTFWQ
ncbi:MAG TPA: hypothetical protein VIL32_13015 [Steroidobacteraceae bacterium]